MTRAPFGADSRSRTGDLRITERSSAPLATKTATWQSITYGHITIDVKAAPVFREKRIVMNPRTGELAIVEINIWKIPKSFHYESGRRFSLFLIADGRPVIGIDNHQPKGPHLHLGDEEVSYNYLDDDLLIQDFWDFVRKAGFEPWNSKQQLSL